MTLLIPNLVLVHAFIQHDSNVTKETLAYYHQQWYQISPSVWLEMSLACLAMALITVIPLYLILYLIKYCVCTKTNDNMNPLTASPEADKTRLRDAQEPQIKRHKNCRNPKPSSPSSSKLSKQHKKKPLIAIEGNISSGKSMIISGLSSIPDTHVVYETISQKLLELFYNNPKLYAFPLQLATIQCRLHQIQSLADPDYVTSFTKGIESDQPCVLQDHNKRFLSDLLLLTNKDITNVNKRKTFLDRSVLGDMGFCMKQVLDGNISLEELTAYRDLLKTLNITDMFEFNIEEDHNVARVIVTNHDKVSVIFPKPNPVNKTTCAIHDIIYLHTTPEICRARVQKRMEVDKDVKYDYLNDLDDLHVYGLWWLFIHFPTFASSHIHVFDWRVFPTPSSSSSSQDNQDDSDILQKMKQIISTKSDSYLSSHASSSSARLYGALKIYKHLFPTELSVTSSSSSSHSSFPPSSSSSSSLLKKSSSSSLYQKTSTIDIKYNNTTDHKKESSNILDTPRHKKGITFLDCTKVSEYHYNNIEQNIVNPLSASSEADITSASTRGHTMHQNKRFIQIEDEKHLQNLMIDNPLKWSEIDAVILNDSKQTRKIQDEKRLSCLPQDLRYEHTQDFKNCMNICLAQGKHIYWIYTRPTMYDYFHTWYKLMKNET
jgi:deoxyadenosine/deoxycytidine kinase